MSPRNYTPKTLKRLFALSGNECAFDGCMKKLVDTKDALGSNICHIEAAYPNGERYNSNMTDLERADYKNLILLCPKHHVETNNVQIYTVEKLLQIKAEHENSIERRVRLSLWKHPTDLATVIRCIGEDDFEGRQTLDLINPFSIQDKINHNSLYKYNTLIQEYSIYQGKINSIYNELSSYGKISMQGVLRKINSFYLEVKNNSTSADDKIDFVIEKLHDYYDKSPNKKENLGFETIEFAIRIIVVDAFMRCKILEAPN